MKTAINQIKHKFRVLPLYLIFIGVIFSASVFLIWLDNARVYQSEISVFFAPKSEVGAWQSEQIIGNLIKFPTKLSFYDQMLKDDDSINDFLVGKSKEEKIGSWNSKIKSERELKSSIVTIKYTDSDSETAEKINRQSVYTLFGIMSRFYDVKKDIDLRIIEGPMVKKEFPGWPWAIIGSLGGGIVFIFLVQLVSFFLGYIQQKILGQIEFRRLVKENLTAADVRLEVPEEKEPADEKFDHRLHFPEVRMAVRKASAPDNLPVADEADWGKESVFEKNEVPKLYEESELEPTEEERKARLNRLLRGEM
jgi:hypothetical protein